MAEIRTRPAEAADRPVLEHFMAALQEHERALGADRSPGHEMAASHMDALFDWTGPDPAAGCRIAEDAEGPVGFVLWGTDSEMGTYIPEATRHQGWIVDLWVEPRARRQGIAAQLIAEAEAHLAAQGIHKITIPVLHANEGAVATYRKLGYAPAEVMMEKRRG